MSADADQPLEDCSRDELEQRVRQLEDAGAAVSMLVNELRDDDAERVEFADPEFVPTAAAAFREFADELADLRATKADFEAFMDEYGLEKARDADEAWLQIVRAARNKQGNPRHTIPATNEIALFVENIETATGYSDRHCSSLIDAYADGKDGTRKVTYEPPTAGNDNSARKKQLVVDLDAWGEES